MSEQKMREALSGAAGIVSAHGHRELSEKLIEYAEALSQREAQEPFGWYFMDDPKIVILPGTGFGLGAEPPEYSINRIPLYTAPPSREVPEEWVVAMKGLVDDIDGLVRESRGVSGLHLNGDDASWSELLPSGRFERLSHLDDARALLASKGGVR